ncbi:DUF547 domain-containing protein [bacterium]|nr:DUF547 domain-containing protein [bacterium]
MILTKLLPILFLISNNVLCFDFSIYQKLLDTSVVKQEVQSKVRYSALKADPEALKKNTAIFSGVSKADFEKWSKNDQMAFLINSYNFFTIKLIVDHYPVKSIKKIGGWFSNPWKKKFFQLLGEERSLDEVEHEMLRRDYSEPRIHFAVNCASKGCPPLQSLAFRSETLDKQLESAALNFINSNAFNRYQPKTNTLELSSIFKWYGNDFGNEMELKTFIAKRHLNLKKKTDELIKETKIVFLDYDWSLNEEP